MPRTSAVSAVDAAFRREWSRLVATLVRELGDLELAEDVAQDAFVEASRRWRTDGVPDTPGAWLLTTARRKAIDRLRRAQRFEDRIPALARAEEADSTPRSLADDQLALIFGCCHPALPAEGQVALTLRSVAGLSTAQIASAFLVPEATMAKRLVRAKKKIRDAGIPFTVPEGERLTDRLDAVCGVIYGIFTEGHASTSGSELVRGGLCDEAVWLAETVAELAPEEPEVRGLAALCLLTDARRFARTDARGEQVLLADQDRSRWDQDKIRRGLGHLASANAHRLSGPYQMRATIAAVHSTARRFEETDWSAIVRVYDVMLSMGGGPVVALNRAVAVAEHRGPAAGLAALDELEAEGELATYRYFHSAKAELLWRMGHNDAAAEAVERAIECSENEGERRWLIDRARRFRSSASASDPGP